MRASLRFAAAVLLSLTLGLHWAALQSLAWSSMFLQRVQTVSVGEALRTTLDGKHPCRLCLVVREGRAAERQQEGLPNGGGATAPRLEFTPATSPLAFDFVAVTNAHPSRAPSNHARRSDPPPLPPPRVA